MGIEMVDWERNIMEEIADKRAKRFHVAVAYWWCLRSSGPIDWRRINMAIIERWSYSALEWIKKRAHNGKCWADEAAENDEDGELSGNPG